jgi:hypothetical protein
MKTILQIIIIALIAVYAVGALNDAIDYEYNKALNTGTKYSGQVKDYANR